MEPLVNANDVVASAELQQEYKAPATPAKNAEKAKEILKSIHEPVYEVGEITEGNQDVVVTGGLFNE